MPNFKPYDYRQSAMVVVNYEEQLQPGTFEHALHHFKALSCDSVPHYTTIAGFVSEHPKEIERIFEQILLICDSQGLLGKGLFAIDGCKL